eukprot:gene10424-2555_t
MTITARKAPCVHMWLTIITCLHTIPFIGAFPFPESTNNVLIVIDPHYTQYHAKFGNTWHVLMELMESTALHMEMADSNIRFVLPISYRINLPLLLCRANAFPGTVWIPCVQITLETSVALVAHFEDVVIAGSLDTHVAASASQFRSFTPTYTAFGIGSSLFGIYRYFKEYKGFSDSRVVIISSGATHESSSVLKYAVDKLKQHNQQIFFVVIPPNSQDFGHHKIHQAPPPVEFTSQFSSLKSVSGAHLSTALLKVFSFADTKLRKVSTPTARAVALEPSTDNHPTAFPHTTHQKTLISSKTALSSSLDETVTAQKTYENLRRILLHLSEMYPISSTPTTMAVLFCVLLTPAISIFAKCLHQASANTLYRPSYRSFSTQRQQISYCPFDSDNQHYDLSGIHKTRNLSNHKSKFRAKWYNSKPIDRVRLEQRKKEEEEEMRQKREAELQAQQRKKEEEEEEMRRKREAELQAQQRKKEEEEEEEMRRKREAELQAQQRKKEEEEEEEEMRRKREAELQAQQRKKEEEQTQQQEDNNQQEQPHRIWNPEQAAQRWYNQRIQVLEPFLDDVRSIDSEGCVAEIRSGIRGIFNKLQHSQAQLRQYAQFAFNLIDLSENPKAGVSEPMGRSLIQAYQKLQSNEPQNAVLQLLRHGRLQKICLENGIHPLTIYILYKVADTYINRSGKAKQDDTCVSDPSFRTAYFIQYFWLQLPEDLSRKFADFIYGLFFKKYPSISGYIPPKENDQDTSTYFETLGYVIVDPTKGFDKIEAASRAFAVLQCTVLPGRPNPYTGVDVIWKCCSLCVNQPLGVGVNSIIMPSTLASLYNSAAWHLHQQYRQQCFKLHRLLIEEYFPAAVAAGNDDHVRNQADYHRKKLIDSMTSKIEPHRAMNIPES